MKLYLANGCYYGTQADARKADRGFGPVEVPTDKAGLIEYLNARRLPAYAAAPTESVSAVVAPTLPAAERPFSAPSVLARMDAFQAIPPQMRLTALEEAIQNADGFELSSLLGNVISRLEELRRQARLGA